MRDSNGFPALMFVAAHEELPATVPMSSSMPMPMVNPEHAESFGGSVSFQEAIRREADAYRRSGTSLGRFFGKVMEEVARKADSVDAKTPKDYWGRLEVLDTDRSVRRAV